MPDRRVWGWAAALLAAALVLLSAWLVGSGRRERARPIHALSPADKWAAVFDPSVLPADERRAELAWFRNAAEPLQGMTIRSIGEDIETVFWEQQVLARAFEELTGIRVQHDVVGEGEVVDRLIEQLEGGTNRYDIFVTDADLIGLHLRMGWLLPLDAYMTDEGARFTNPRLDLADFLNPEFGRDYDGRQLQIPDYQFALVYWFRHDWFSDPATQAAFRERFGYELGVPLNWSAYEDIAAFFTGRRMQNPNDSEVVAFGHADYARPGPWLGWRFSDAFMAIAGMGDPGLPNGMPVDEWGIRVEDRIPVGASVERGGAINSPAAVYALTKWIEYLDKYAPPESRQLDWLGLGPRPARGDIAQTWYWTPIYAALNPAYNKIGSPVCDRQGRPVWRVAPVPQGRYWEPGMKRGYQDAGSWSIPLAVTGNRRHAAWLWAQFCLSKTVAIKKFQAGSTPVRRSTLYSDFVTRDAERYGGLIEFLRSPMIRLFTDSGPNVPHYPRLSALWWRHVQSAASGDTSPQQALDALAQDFDRVMGELNMPLYSPRLNPARERTYWLNQPGAPKPERPERPAPATVTYEDLLREWRRARP